MDTEDMHGQKKASSFEVALFLIKVIMLLAVIGLIPYCYMYDKEKQDYIADLQSTYFNPENEVAPHIFDDSGGVAYFQVECDGVTENVVATFFRMKKEWSTLFPEKKIESVSTVNSSSFIHGFFVTYQ